MIPDSDDREIFECFVIEANETLDEVEPRLIEMQQHADDSAGDIDQDNINFLFRLFHTLKGGAGFLNLSTVTAVTHEAETLLDLFRNGKAICKKSDTDLLCQTIDFVRKLIETIDVNFSDEGFEAEGDVIIDGLKAAINETGQPSSSSDSSETSPESKTNEFDDFTIEITPEMVEKFVEEGSDLIEEAEGILLELEKNPNDRELISNIFRNIHSFKGNCGFFGYKDLETISHKAEEVLEAVKDKKIDLDQIIISTLISTVDFIKRGLSQLSRGESGDIENYSELIEVLGDRLPVDEDEISGPVSSVLDESSGGQVFHVLVAEDEPTQLNLLVKILGKANFRTSQAVDGNEALNILGNQDKENRIDLLLTDIRMPNMTGEELSEIVNNKYPTLPILVTTAEDDKELLKKLLKLDIAGYVDKPFVGETLVELIKNIIKQSVKKNIVSGGQILKSGDKSQKIVRRDIRVDLDKLDTLINLVGELIISREMVTRNQDLEGLELPNFERSVHQLHLITNELQDIAMAVRMVPLSILFRKMIRLVHDLSSKSGKKIKLQLSGEDTEVDKSVIDQISDPLVHMIRNAGDHGIETAEERISLGKTETGTIKLSAEQKGNEVWVIVQEDGRGLRREKILEKGIKNGLVKGDGSDMRDEDVFQLIFEPGFSTAEKLTDISGRGVGMDVVKKNIEKIKGRIVIESVAGEGTCFTIRIPLTLATIVGMLVRVGTVLYTIPITGIRESLRPQAHDITTRPDGQEFVKIRNELYPVIRLHRLHNIIPTHTEAHEGIVVVLESGGEIIGLFVDEILHQIETVIKGLSKFFGNIKGISGCNILGNGQVSLILDIEGLVHNYSVVNEEYQLVGT